MGTRRIQFDPVVLIDLFKSRDADEKMGYRIVQPLDPLPDDAEIVGVIDMIGSRTIELRVRSGEWEDTPPFAADEILTPAFRVYWVPVPTEDPDD